VSAPWPRAEPIITRRLELEPLRVDHAREMAPVLADPALHAFIGGEPSGADELSARCARLAARARRGGLHRPHPSGPRGIGRRGHLGLQATDQRRDGEVRWIG
jgi:hypothetical protein